jgi:NAD(P)-dependent dehydrogenase (short-subunit alcohol dehydrogenase family)
MKRLEGKSAIVTGAAQGIGFAIASLFHREGANVVFTDLQIAGLAQRVRELGVEESLAVAEALDVTVEADWERVFSDTQRRFGGIDILVNNAGVAAEGSVENTSLESWREVIRVNLDGTFLGCQHAVRHMKQHGGGSIVNISSIGALKASAVGPAYGASKAGVWNLTKNVALLCAKSGYGIRCNSIHPGLTRTPMMDGVSEDLISRLVAGIPLGRIGEPIDIAYAALYLASDEAAFTTGQHLIVDGGALT